MAIPENYIDKFTDVDSGERRDICPAADKVRVDNDNFEGTDLDEVLDEIADAIDDAGSGGYAPPAGGIPKTDLSSDVQTSLGKADTAYQKPASGIPATDLADGVIPEKVSDLTNDLGFQTQAQVAAAISQAAIEAIVGNGDFAMTYDEGTDTFNIVRLVPTLQVTPLSSMSASTKSGTFKVSGTNLKGDVTIALPQGASNWLLSTGGGAGASSLTLSPTNGTLAETTITVAYSGSTDSVGNTITISSTNAESKTVTANYTVTAGPTIFADATKTVTAIAGSSATTTIEVTASQLTEGITVIKGGTNPTKFNVTPASLGTSGGTLNVQFSPDESDTSNQSATITLRSSGADDVVITLTGQVLVPSLSITPSTISLESDNNVAATGTINVKGTNIVGNVALAISGSGFSLSANSLAAADVNSTNGVDVTVTANIASGTTASATITATSGQASATASASWSKTEPAPAVNDTRVDKGIKYKITAVPDGSTPGACQVVNDNSAWAAPSYKGDIVIPDYITLAGQQYNVTSIGANAFYNAQSVTSISLGANITSIGIYAFYGTGISTIDLPAAISTLPSNLCQNCSNLSSITLRYEGVVPYGNSALSNTAINNGIVYVPSSQLTNYTSPDYNTNPTIYNNAHSWDKSKSGFQVSFQAITE